MTTSDDLLDPRPPPDAPAAPLRKMGRDIVFVSAWAATFAILVLQCVLIAWMLA